MLLSFQKGIPTNQSISVPNGVSHNTFDYPFLIHYPTVYDGNEVDVLIKGLWRFHISYHLLHSKGSEYVPYIQAITELFSVSV